MVIRPGRAPIRSSGGAYRAAIAFLRSLGTSAHVWLPGASGVSVASLPSNNYLLSDGSTGFSTVDSVDGLTLDGMGSLGSELVSNPGPFTATTGWASNGTQSVVSGNLRIANDAADFKSTGSSCSTVIGKTYVLTVIRAGGTAPTGGVKVGSVYGGSDYYALSLTITNSRSVTFVATTTTVYFRVYSGDNVIGNYSDYSNISVREYTGIHLTQPTTANKPLVRRGMYNLLRQSQALATAPWALRSGTIVATNNFAVGLDGTTTATKLDKTGVVDSVWQYPNVSDFVALNTPYTGVAYFLKSATVNIVEFVLRIVCITPFTDNSIYVSFNTLSGVTYVRGDAGTPAGTVSVADAGTYWVVAITKSTPPSGTFSDPALLIRPCIGATLGGYDAAATGSCVVWRAGMFAGTWTAAQILAEGGIPPTTATAASNPSAGKYWWSFNGSNNSLLSGNLGITNACTIVISLRVNSLAATQIIFAEDTNGAQVSIATNGAVSLTKVGGAALVTTAAGVVVAGVPLVLTVRLSAGTADIRKNGAQSATAASALTFSAVTGARVGTAFDGTTSPTNGALGWVVPLPTALSDADCLTVERLVSSQFPNGPVF